MEAKLLTLQREAGDLEGRKANLQQQLCAMQDARTELAAKLKGSRAQQEATCREVCTVHNAQVLYTRMCA